MVGLLVNSRVIAHSVRKRVRIQKNLWIFTYSQIYDADTFYMFFQTLRIGSSMFFLYVASLNNHGILTILSEVKKIISNFLQSFIMITFKMFFSSR